MLQHGRSVALAVSIKEAPDKLLEGSQPDLLDPLMKTFSNDRVSFVQQLWFGLIPLPFSLPVQ